MPAQSRNRIGEILVKAKVIDDLQLRSALAHVDQWGGRLTLAVLDMNLANEDKVVTAIAQALNVPAANLGGHNKDGAALAKVDVTLAEQSGIFPFALKDNGKTLHVAMADPTNLAVIDELGRKARARVVPYIAGEIEIRHAIMRHYKGIEPPARKSSGIRPSEAFDGDEDQEFKITDMNGKTLMKRLSDIDPGLAAQMEQEKKGVAVAITPQFNKAPVAPPPKGDASDLLEDLLSGGSGQPGQVLPRLSEADMQRVLAVKANQEKSAVILRALQELLTAKGYFK